MEKIKIMIVDDHMLVREGIQKLLELNGNIEVVHMASNGEEALECLIENQPDVVLLDINMPKMNGIDCLGHIQKKYPELKVIMLTIHDDADYVMKTMEMGAKGYLMKDVDLKTFLKAIEEVMAGGFFIQDEIKAKISSNESLDYHKLTPREKEVLVLIARGLSNKEIGQELYISEKTVKNHVSSVLKKIAVNDRTQAALYAVKHKMKI